MRDTQSDVITNSLVQRYGHMMKAPEVASELRYDSVAALRMARKRGLIELDPLRADGRRAQMFSTVRVAAVLKNWLNDSSQEKEQTMPP